jgi:hypothetical protein
VGESSALSRISRKILGKRTLPTSGSRLGCSENQGSDFYDAHSSAVVAQAAVWSDVQGASQDALGRFEIPTSVLGSKSDQIENLLDHTSTFEYEKGDSPLRQVPLSSQLCRRFMTITSVALAIYSESRRVCRKSKSEGRSQKICPSHTLIELSNSRSAELAFPHGCCSWSVASPF